MRFPAVRLVEPDVVDIILGQSPASSSYNATGEGDPFYQGKADFGRIHPSTRVWCTAGGSFAEPNDVLLSVRAPVGDVNIANQRCAIGRGVTALRAGARCDPIYLFFAMQFARPDLERRATGSTFASVNKASLLDLEIPLPDPTDQRDIGRTLLFVANRIEQESRVGALASILKRAAMRELFTGGLRGDEQKETEFGFVPAHWDVAVLDDVGVVQTGAAKGRQFGDADTVEVPYLRVANVQDGHLNLSEMKTIKIRQSEVERYRLRNGDVVLTEGGDFDKLGRGFIWSGELDLCVHQNHVFAVRPDTARLIPKFFAYQCQSAYGKAYFLKVAHKTTNLACINSTKLKAFPALVPPDTNEQHEIVEILVATDQKIDLHKQKKVVLEELFKALLHKLMTGEIRVADLDVSTLAEHK